jgi:26S proteasome regulatory subunit N7
MSLTCPHSVMLSSMATSFGISTELLDAELSRFIAAGRLNAKIDKVRITSALLYV